MIEKFVMNEHTIPDGILHDQDYTMYLIMIRS